MRIDLINSSLVNGMGQSSQHDPYDLDLKVEFRSGMDVLNNDGTASGTCKGTCDLTCGSATCLGTCEC
jgi:hypothetical protein